MARQSTIPQQTVFEDIRSISEVVGSHVYVMVGKVDSSGEFLVPQQYESYEITGDDFTELMSASPTWAPGKPANTYRNEDLWIFIDRNRSAV